MLIMELLKNFQILILMIFKKGVVAWVFLIGLIVAKP